MAKDAKDAVLKARARKEVEKHAEARRQTEEAAEKVGPLTVLHDQVILRPRCLLTCQARSLNLLF